VVLTDNHLNASPFTTQIIALSGAAPTPIAPYIEVNGGAWQQVNTVAVNVGDTVNLAGQNISGGSWSWTGPNGFTGSSREIDAVLLTSASNVYNLTYTNTGGATSTQSFTVTVNPTQLTPYIEVNGGAWQQVSSIAVNLGDTVNLAPTNISGGIWSWTGPNGFTSASRQINAVPLNLPSNSYTATYTNASGVTSTQTFTITINPTQITPYIEVNGGAWQQASSVAANLGDTVNLAPTNISGGSWSWTGPSGFTSASRQINAVPLNLPSNSYTASYTNTSGVTSTQTFTVTVNPTQLTPYIEVNGGAWQQVSGIAVNLGDTVNLAPLNISGGSWSWTGPNGFTSASRQINAVPLNLASNSYTATYTNTSGVTSTQTFTLTVNPTQLAPYIQVNGGVWQQVSSVAVNLGDTVNLAPTNISGGIWSWTGPNGFTSASRQINAVPLNLASNSYTATYTNTSGVISTQTFTVTVNRTAVVPYLEVNSGVWQQATTVSLNLGDKVNLAGQQLSVGTWGWTGPNGFTSTSREIDNVPLASSTNVYTLTYTNAAGVSSSPQIFTVTINPTPVVPYIQENGGAWLQTASASVAITDRVNLAGLPQSGGTWSWTGPNSFTASTREIDAVPLASGTNTYTATYTNAVGVNSTQVFIITANT
jgi:hypothetical protein